MRVDANRREESHAPAGFGLVLQSYRLAAGVSQAELAERAGLSQRGISDLERGARRTPYLGTVRRLAQALDLDRDGMAALLAAARGQPAPEATSPPPPVARAALPVPPTSFVGREQALVEIQNRLGNTRLLTLTGPGGIGKTRLALEVVRGLGQREATQGFVELASVHDPALVPQTAAANLGVREDPHRGIVETLIDALRSRSLVLVLDNCEHVLAACAALVEQLLRACPGLRILTTSRERFGIAGETLWRVPPLESADPRHLPPVAELGLCPAVRLFLDRASAVDSRCVLTDLNARTLADICQRLDGIPLAIGGGHLGYHLTCLGLLEHNAGDMDAAWRTYREALEVAREAQDEFVILMTLQAMAGVLAVTGQARMAARLVGLVSSQRMRIGGAMEPTPGLAEHQRWTIDQLRRDLGKREFAAAEAAGRGMTPELAVLDVLALDPGVRQPPGGHRAARRSRRE